MATTPIQFYAPKGLTLTLELFPFGSDTRANGLGDVCTEKINAHGLYEAPVTEAITGLHNAVVVDAANNVIALYTVNIIADDTTVYRCSDDTAGVIALPTLVADVWDETLTGVTHNVPNSAGRRLRNLEVAGYQDGAVWIDTINGSAGTDVGENGVPWNPSLTLADALTLAAAAGLTRLVLAPGSSITLVAPLTNYHVSGLGATVALGGQAISGCIFTGTTITGIATGTGIIQFLLCKIGTAVLSCTLPPCHIHNSDIVNDVISNAAGDYFFDKCQSNIAGVLTPSFDFGAAVGDVNLNLRAYSGGITLEAMGDLGTDTASIEGWGQIIEGTCTGGTVAIRGHFTLSGITNLTLSDDARIDVFQVVRPADLPTNFKAQNISVGGIVESNLKEVDGNATTAQKFAGSAEVLVLGTVDTVVNGHTPTATEFQCDDITDTQPNNYIGRVIIFRTGAITRQGTRITGYILVGGIAQFTVEALTIPPANDDKLVIV